MPTLPRLLPLDELLTVTVPVREPVALSVPRDHWKTITADLPQTRSAPRPGAILLPPMPIPSPDATIGVTCLPRSETDICIPTIEHGPEGPVITGCQCHDAGRPSGPSLP